MRITTKEALSKLADSKALFKTLFKHGTLSVEIYKPDQVDVQQPHKQDEVYVVISGSGTFVNGTETMPFGPGDFLFVAAGVEHRFLDFTEDFSTWVIFFGK